ncbi:MAG TPA: GAF domain-containing sensor histidine kinase [Ktedonobacteraceae bacterium]|nr:GAF domain-containing sensor histidine kinase [Ktedonobacteraceae bacterium]
MSSEHRSGIRKQGDLLTLLQQFLVLPATDVAESLQQAAQLLTEALSGEKADIFLYDSSAGSLIACGMSNTPMEDHQKELGLDHLPVANGGRAIEVYQSGQPYQSGQVHHDPYELAEIKEGLQVKSEMLVPLDVNGQRRGVVLVSSSHPDYFTPADLHFLEAITHWVGVILYRAELVEQLTRQAQEQAQRLAAESILTMMAHDMGNYLTPLKGRIDLLEMRARREKQDVYVRELGIASLTLSRLNSFISDLLDIERLRQGVFALHLQPVNLQELIEEIIPIWSVPEHGIEMQASSPLIVLADPDRIQQVLENLFSNAVTHSTVNTPIQVTLTRGNAQGHAWVCVVISSHGPSIPPEQLASLFEPFAKGASSRGLGLGLYVSQRIAQAHHGTLTIQTEAPDITRFTLCLPHQRSSPQDKES